MLIVSFQKRDNQDIVIYSDIKPYLQQEDTQISKALKNLKTKGLIENVSEYQRFKQFKITKQGKIRAQVIIGNMRELITIS